MVRMMPQAQASNLPRSSGDGRFRANAAASLRQRSAYSPFRCSPQNASVNSTRMFMTAFGSVSPPMAADFFLGAFFLTTEGAEASGSDVMIP